MALNNLETINLGVLPDGATGDTPRSAFNKVNNNTTKINNGKLDTTGGLIAGTLRVQPNLNDQLFMRADGTTGVTIDAVNAANSAYAPLSLQGSPINLKGTVNATSNILTSAAFFASQVFAATGNNVMLATNGAATVYLRPNGTGSSSGQATLTAAGTFAAPVITQTSSADVKDNLEGFAESASDLLDRLVVITHTYLPEFIDDGGETHISLLAENVRDVIPSATTGDYTVTETEQYEEPGIETITYTREILDQNGNPLRDEYGNPETETVTVDLNVVNVKTREIQSHVPLSVKVMEMMALSVRAHQEKNRRIKQLEDTVAALVARLDAAGI